LTVFFFAFLPQFVSADEANPLLQMLGMSGIFVLVTFVVFAAYGLLAASVRDQILSCPQVLAWMWRAFAGAFAELGPSWRCRSGEQHRDCACFETRLRRSSA
jgi:threonine/homoserine/homoserine lactone efflux protein